ncbi:MAG: 2-oxoacid:acceptor oxidoreductase family protein, partial [Fervidicoccaceae archaeon]
VEATGARFEAEGPKIVSEDLISTALEAAGTRSAINVVAVGYVASATDLVRLSSLEEALKDLLVRQSSSLERNLKALRAGAELAKKSGGPRERARNIIS